MKAVSEKMTEDDKGETLSHISASNMSECLPVTLDITEGTG
jgi:hypothetical protein